MTANNNDVRMTSYFYRFIHQPVSKNLASIIKQARTNKGITQQELSDCAGISLRSVQRIENNEVSPRSYTIRLLAEHLGLNEKLVLEKLSEDKNISPPLPGDEEQINTEATAGLPVLQVKSKNPGKIILSAGTGLLLILATLAFIFQSPKFPETAFEATLLWIPITTLYIFMLYRIWK